MHVINFAYRKLDVMLPNNSKIKKFNEHVKYDILLLADIKYTISDFFQIEWNLYDLCFNIEN